MAAAITIRKVPAARIRRRHAILCALLAASSLLGDPQEQVRRESESRIVTPVNQIVEPAGRQVNLPGLRPLGLALSPNGRILVTSGKTRALVVMDPVAGQITQTVEFPEEKADSSLSLPPDSDGQLSFTGLVFAPDGSRIFLSDVTGCLKVFSVDAAERVSPGYSIPLPPANAPRRKAEIPAGLAFSKDGTRLYAALNLGNRAAELDANSGAVLRTWDVGVAPYDVIVAGRKVYVSNWGGRRPQAGDLTGPAGRGTVVRVDGTRFIACEGSVSVIDLDRNIVSKELLTGKHASAMALSPNGKFVVAANAGDDTLSVIDTRTDSIVETISARRQPGDLFGASPNALAFDRAGRRLFVCNGTQNALAVFDFKPGASRWRGLTPVGWYPGAIVCDAARKSIYVANIKGMGNGLPRKSNGKPEFNTHQFYGSITLLNEPSRQELAAGTRRALANMRYPLLREAALPPRANQAPAPVPQRVGEPSVFKHVVYLIKENRTYDQVLGDMPEGNGDPELCVFGARVTPNEHKLARDFVLLDNTYCSGLFSADGHQWADSAMAADYMEKSFYAFARSYPDGMEDDDVDALAYSPAGFIWDNVLAHGKTLRDYGEFAITRKSWKNPARKGGPEFIDHYHEFLHDTGLISIHSDPSVESLRPFLCRETAGWDLAVPDVFRAEKFIGELKKFEAADSLANLTIICLPNDHTSGTDYGRPKPEAQVADNDLAFGRIVEAISRSRFWKDTCILAIEDDPQNGWDHVSGFRTTAYMASPYTKRHQVISSQYNQTSLLRTIELILGLPPMNQMDATATPMRDCFTGAPDFSPWESVTNNIPLDDMNPDPKRISDALLRKDARRSARLPWKLPDQCPEDVLNRILWRAVKGSRVPYPAWAVQMTDDD